MLPKALTRWMAAGVAVSVFAGPPATALAHEIAHHRAEHEREGDAHHERDWTDARLPATIGTQDDVEGHAHLRIDRGLSVKFDSWHPAASPATPAPLDLSAGASRACSLYAGESFEPPPSHPPPGRPRAPPRP